MTASAAVAVLLRTIVRADRRQIWDISSVQFLILFILSVCICIAGLVVVDPVDLKFYKSFLFFLSVFIPLIVSFYFLKAVTFPIILFFIGGFFFIFYNFLDDFNSLDRNYRTHITVLGDEEDLLVLEVQESDKKVQFITLDYEKAYPVFVIVEFSEYLFFLPSTSFIKFEGFSSDPDKISEIIEHSYRNSDIAELPFHRLLFYESPEVSGKIYSKIIASSDTGKSIIFHRGK